jgi:nicotinamidase-related amidase
MPERALVIIDIQNDYFPGGAMELEGADAAAANASKALARARREGVPVFHVRHVSTRPGATFFIPGTKGAEIHAAVRPQSAERVIEKNFPNSFRGTELERALKDAGVKELVVAGMMTHMCVDASVRQAADLGYKVTLLGDACATRAQTFGGETVAARQVHAAFLAALNGFYAKVVRTDEL